MNTPTPQTSLKLLKIPKLPKPPKKNPTATHIATTTPKNTNSTLAPHGLIE
jgi:hypothetical protein